MLGLFILGYCLYFAVNIYTSFMQVAYVKNARLLQPIILENEKYVEAANYSIEKEK